MVNVLNWYRTICMVRYEEIVAKVLRDYADKLESGTCLISQDEALNIVSQVAHIAMNKQQVADRYGVSTKTIERKEKEGSIPKGHTVSSSKKVWFLDDLIEYEEI